MFGFLTMFAGRGRLVMVLAALLAVAAMCSWSYVQGRSDGRAAEAVTWQKRELDQQAKAGIERAQLQKAIEVRNAEIEARNHAAADAVEHVRVEFLPAKTVVKREIVDRPVFRDCRIGDGMRDTINAALRGAPIANAAGGSRADGLPGRAAGIT